MSTWHSVTSGLAVSDDLDLPLSEAERVADALNMVAAKLRREMAYRPPLCGLHEGYAALYAEVAEVRGEVEHGTTDGARAAVVRVAAMALRFLVDIPVRGDQPTTEIG